jgi:uncharacterized protein (TIGR03437 family)
LAQAPFLQPTVTDDGQTVFFTSALVPASAPPASGSPPRGSGIANLYKLGPSGIQLISESANKPQVSGDGRTLVFTDPSFCVPAGQGTSCNAQGKLAGPPETNLGAGYAQVSRNGRWILSYSLGLPTLSPATLIDNNTGARTEIPGAAPFTMLSGVASDGTVFVQELTAPVAYGIWRDGIYKRIVPERGSTVTSWTPMALSDDASTLIAMAQDPGPAVSYHLIAKNLATGTDTSLFESVSPFQLLGVSTDGKAALIRVVAAPSILNVSTYFVSAGAAKAELIALPDGETAADGTINGPGNTLILTTSSGRILRIPVVAGIPGAAQEVVPATPYLSGLHSFSGGAYLVLNGSLGKTVADVAGKVFLDGIPLAILAVKPGEVTIQVPWEAKSGLLRFHLTIPSASPFKQDQIVFVSPLSFFPLSLPAGQTSILGSFPLIRGDFSGIQTTQPKAGDVMIAYFTGLGPVQGSPVTGQPAPSSPLFRIQAALTCRFLPRNADATTLFAGLAPGMIGVYQVAFQMPEDANTSPLTGLQCSWRLPDAVGSFTMTHLTTPN